MSPILTDLINRPLNIGPRTLPGRLILAPMTGLGHVAFRHWLDELGGCALMYSEMCSAARIPQENRRRSPYFRWRDEEAERLVIQILGSDPDRMADAACRIEAEGLFGVDINLGCSVKDICRYNQGAALLKAPDEAVRLVSRVRRVVRCPLTVKFRTGWQDTPDLAVDLARRLEQVGVDALIFHPRVAPDVRTRPPKWEYIGLVKQAVGIPVFGNGNIFSAEDCLRMMRITGCDGVALGRIAAARPWVFADWSRGAALYQPDRQEYPRNGLRLWELLLEHFEPAAAIRRFKQFASYLAANFAFGNTLFNHIRRAGDGRTIESVLEAFFREQPHMLQYPNMNFLR